VTNRTLRPVLLSVSKERVYALDLVDVRGVLAIPPDGEYRYLGDVFQEFIIQDGMRVKRWFATTIVESTLGPYADKLTAQAALLDWHHVRSADLSETSTPLF